MRRRATRGFLTLGAVMIAVGAWFTGTMRAGDNLDHVIAGNIRDIFWDSRLFDGTPGFPGAILWYHNATGMPGNVSRTEFEARVEAAFNTWDAVDAGIAGPPLVPIVNLGGQISAADPFALDGINVVGWQAEGYGGTLAVTPCWTLTEPTTTIADGSGNTVIPISDGPTIPFPGPVGVTYPAGAMLDCGMRFDSADAWSTAEIPFFLLFDVQSVATHEGGHFIGLSHSTVGDFTGADLTNNATMLPFGAQGDTTFRTLEEDDRASVLRTYARNRAGGPIAQTAGGRGLIELTLLKGGTCLPATGVSVVAYKTSSGIAGPGRVETFSGSHLRLGILDEPANGSVTLNVLPLPPGESYTLYARTFEQGLGAFSSQRYNYTTINSNLLDLANRSRTFDHLAVVNSIGAGETIDLGDVGIAGCWMPNPTSEVDVVAESMTAPATAFTQSQIAVTSSFRNQGSVATGPFKAGIYVSTDTAINADDTFTGFSCSVPNLLPGATATCNGLADVPEQVGTYYFGLLADFENQVVESLEYNNGVAPGNLTTVTQNPVNPIVNGSFETGNLTGWSVKELTPASNPSLPISVRGAGVEYPLPTFNAPPYVLDYFGSAPTHGQWAVLHDFNGDDPATTGFVNRRELYQDITLPSNTTTLRFDYRAAWELFRFGSTQDRTFDFEIEPAGGGATWLTQRILTAPNQTIEEDTDNPTGGEGYYPPGRVDLSAFAGQNVRMKFVWNIPEPGTGFGFFQLDNIRLYTAPASNTAPVVTITAPADGSIFTAGDSIVFTGSATDSEDGDLSATVAWSSSLDGAIGSGANFSRSTLSVGSHTITASVTDSALAVGSASITLTVNPPPNNQPTVTITAPGAGSTFVVGHSISFAGSANDVEDGNISANLTWSSSLNGSIGSGPSFSTTALGVGTHTITASVTDSDLATGVDSITLTVNPAPNPDIDNVATADFATANGTIVGGTFANTQAEDDVYEILAEEIQGQGSASRRRSLLEHTWTFNVVAGAQYVFKVSAHHNGTEDDFAFAYSRDNVVFTPMLIVTGTTDGDVVQSYLFPQDVRGLVYVRVQDTDRTRGNATQDSLFVDYMAITTRVPGGSGTAPQVTITAPPDGSVVTSGVIVSFTATASDAEDGNVGASLQWTSSINGPIGSGAAFSTSALSVGAHIITASVTDSQGLQGVDSIAITVTAPQAITLTVRGYKVQGVQHADLTWTGATGGTVVITRNGQTITTAPNTGAYTDNIGVKGSGSYTYQVCVTGGSSCSNLATITF